ncbi:MAG: cell division protein SepF [Clostridia bacterium]|nr:cell division protein SepF [Clostridia bacterium]
MANMLDRLLNAVGWDAEVEETEEDFEPITKKPEKKKPNGKVVAMPVSGGSTLNVLYPESFDEARTICQFLRLNQAVIVNLENMNRDSAQRIVDFISGAVYSLDGGIKKISAGIFVVTPSTFIVEENSNSDDVKKELEDRATSPWAN